jgi:YD repeat-containing protein
LRTIPCRRYAHPGGCTWVEVVGPPVGVDGEGALLIRKVDTDAAGAEVAVWTYAWNGTGMLARVTRPDGQSVTFTGC